jgi:tetratricopeptide (TPR) repeat protein
MIGRATRAKQGRIMPAIRSPSTSPGTSGRRWVRVVCLLTILAAGQAAAADSRQWVLARSPGFIVISDAGEKKARQVAHQFEQVRGLFREILQARVDPGRLVIIFAVKDEDGLRELLPAFWERKGGARPAGVFIPGRDKHLVALRLDAETENPYHVLYHEYTHLLTQLNVRWVPLWLNEGLAEFYGASEIDEKEVRWGLVSGSHVLVLRHAPLLKLDELLAADATSPLYNEASRTGVFYAQSAVLTHYLLLGAAQRRGQLQELFKLLEGDVDEPEALRRAFGDLRKLESELSTYVRRLSFPGIKTEVRIDAQQIQAMPLGPAEADALRGDFLARTGRPREGRALLESALRQDAQLSWAHEGLGVVESDRGRLPEALRHFTEAVRLSPRNYLAQFRAGLIEEARADHAADAARRERALRAAAEANPSFAPAFAALARLLSGREDRRAEAVTLAERATALEPAVAWYRVVLWQALSRAGRAGDAARVEAGLVNIARRDPGVLADLTRELDEGGRAAEAESLLRKARETNPRSGALTMILASFLDDHDQRSEAEKLLREAVAANPQSEAIAANLAWILSESPATAAEGLERIERTLKRSPDIPAFLDTKGWALFQLRRLPEAETVLRAAVEGREDADILEHLGDVVREQGRKAEALALYERALDAPDLKARNRASLQSKIERARNPATSPAP